MPQVRLQGARVMLFVSQFVVITPIINAGSIHRLEINPYFAIGGF